MFKKIKYNSPVVLSYALLSLIVLIIGMITDDRSTIMLFSVYDSSLLSPFFYIRLFGHVLGHGNIEHYVGNFLLILMVGPMLEERYGTKKLLIMILITAFITGLVHIIFFDTRLLGASGVVFMMILLSSYTNLQKGRVPLTLILIIAIFIGREVFESITAENSNISYLSHILGGVLGVFFGYFANKKR